MPTKRAGRPPRPRPEGIKTGRYQKIIDWDQVDEWLIAGADGSKIAAAIGMHPETFYDRCVKEKGVCFTDYQTSKRYKGDNNLLTRQYNKAMDGSDSMLIWLGKVRLEQKEQKNLLPPREEILLLEDRIIQLLKENKELRDALESKTATELPGS